MKTMIASALLASMLFAAPSHAGNILANLGYTQARAVVMQHQKPPASGDQTVTFNVKLQLEKLAPGANVSAACYITGMDDETMPMGWKDAPQTAGADGRWNGTVSVPVVVSMYQAQKALAWICSAYAWLGSPQSPIWNAPGLPMTSGSMF